MSSFERRRKNRLSSHSARRNPYLLLLMATASAFLVTAGMYCGSLLTSFTETQNFSMTALLQSLEWSSPTAALLGVELMGMIAATLAVAGYEDAERAQFESTSSRRQQ